MYSFLVANVFAMICAPETPFQLGKLGKNTLAENSLRRLRGPNYGGIEKELKMILSIKSQGSSHHRQSNNNTSKAHQLTTWV